MRCRIWGLGVLGLGLKVLGLGVQAPSVCGKAKFGSSGYLLGGAGKLECSCAGSLKKG